MNSYIDALIGEGRSDVRNGDGRSSRFGVLANPDSSPSIIGSIRKTSGDQGVAVPLIVTHRYGTGPRKHFGVDAINHQAIACHHVCGEADAARSASVHKP